MSAPDRRALLDRDHGKLSIRRQCMLLSVARSGVYHKIFPYLLRGLAIERANQVWAADITYVPIGRGFLYLVAVIDWASRAVLAWRLSNTMDVSFCVSALEAAPGRLGTPATFNTDPDTPFTSAA